MTVEFEAVKVVPIGGYALHVWETRSEGWGSKPCSFMVTWEARLRGVLICTFTEPHSDAEPVRPLSRRRGHIGFTLL